MEASQITNVDRLVLLLRERLAARGQARASAPASVGRKVVTPADTVRALAAMEGMDDQRLRRALVQNLLLESFGERVYDAQFQQVVERVTQTIEADAAAAALLQRLVGELKAEAAR